MCILLIFSLSTLVLDFMDGNTRQFDDVLWLETFSSVVGTRIFDNNAPRELELSGPGNQLLIRASCIVIYLACT